MTTDCYAVQEFKHRKSFTKGANEMKDESYEKRYFEDLSGYVLYETTTKEIKDIVIDSQKINVIGLDEFVKLKAKNLKLKRKTKKLYKKMMYYKDLLGGVDD